MSESRQPNLHIVAGRTGPGRAPSRASSCRSTTPELAIERVQERVRSSGHSIPDEVVRRRFGRGLQNFFRVCAPVVDAWLIFDNSGTLPELLAFWVSGQQFVFDRELFEAIKREGAGHERAH